MTTDRLIRDAASLASELLESSSAELGERLAVALDSGGRLSVEVVVLPGPGLRVLLTGPDGHQAALAEVAFERARSLQ